MRLTPASAAAWTAFTEPRTFTSKSGEVSRRQKRVDSGGVVDDSATSHGVQERSLVEDVAVHGLGSQRA